MVKTDFQNDFKDLYIPDTFAAYEDDGETYEMQEVFNQLDSDMMTIWELLNLLLLKMIGIMFIRFPLQVHMIMRKMKIMKIILTVL